MIMANPAGPDRPRPYAEAFQRYWDAGWPGLFPLPGKYPPPEGWTGAAGAWPSYPDLMSWAETHGGQNIALRMPDGVLGIDVDAYRDKRGGVTLTECETLWGALPATWRSTSRDDGVSGIRLFRVPTGLSWPGQLPGGGVETITVTHRYCVCPPSVHPEGRVYRWLQPGGAVAITTVPSPAELPKLPASWIAGLMRGPETHQAKADLGGETLEWITNLPGADLEPCAFAAGHTREILTALTAGQSRHEVLVAPLLNLIRTFERGHPGALAALGEVQARFVLAVTDDGTRTPSAAAAEFARAVKGAAQRIQGDRSWPTPHRDPCLAVIGPVGSFGAPTANTAPWTGNNERAPRSPEQLLADRVAYHRADRAARKVLDAEEAPPPEDIPGRVSLTRYLAEPDQPVVDRLHAVLPVGARVLLSASMKAGKTSLVANLIRALVDGTPFLGMFPLAAALPPGGRVVLLDNEMNPPTLRRWLRDQAIENTDAVEVVPMLGQTRAFDIRIPSIFDYWVKDLTGTTVLIVDCLKPILDSLDLDERGETGKITTPLTALKQQADISELFLVHHMGHMFERARGDSALRGWPEVEWQLVREINKEGGEPEMDAPRFFKAYGRDVHVPETGINFDAGTRRMTVNGASRTQAKAQASVQRETEMGDRIMALIRDKPGIGMNAIHAAVGGKEEVPRRVVLKLTGEGKIIRKSEGPGKPTRHYPMTTASPATTSLPLFGEAVPTPPRPPVGGGGSTGGGNHLPREVVSDDPADE